MDIWVLLVAALAAMMVAITATTLVTNYTDRKWQRLKNDQQTEMMYHLQNNALEMARSKNVPKDQKGFSDDDDEIKYLLRNVRNELRHFSSQLRVSPKSPSIETEAIVNEIMLQLRKTFSEEINTDELVNHILTDMTEKMSVDHFYELKESSLKSTIQDTRKTLMNVLHVLRTPLSGMRISLDALDRLNEPCNEGIQQCCQQMENCISVIESNMRALGTFEEYDDTNRSLKDVVQQNMGLLLLTANKKVELHTEDIPENISVSQDEADAITLCLACIVENAISAAPDNSEVVIEANQNEDHYCIEVTNYGSSISDEVAKKIFDDAVTVREGGHGIGLHLAQSVAIERLNGHITFDNLSDPQRVRFSLYCDIR